MRNLLIISLLFLIGCCPISKTPPTKTNLPNPKGVVQVYSGGAWGTGFVIKKISPNSYWVSTCFHVVKTNAAAIGVNSIAAKIIAKEEIRDIAILVFESDKELPVYKFGKPVTGEPVMIIGRPPIMTKFGPMMKPIHHKGIISWIQGGQVGVDAGVVSGMSGAPVFNSKGEVIAMVRAHFGGLMTKSEVLGSAIHTDQIKKVIPK